MEIMSILVTGGAGYIGSHTSIADASKAKRELGWAAKRDIVNICRDSWVFERNNNE